MGDHQNSLLLEFLGNHILNQEVILGIDIGCGFIYQYNLSLLKHSPANANELLLTSGKTVVANFSIQASFRGYYIENIALSHRFFKLSIRILIKDI